VTHVSVTCHEEVLMTITAAELGRNANWKFAIGDDPP
jgi:hypothetical protein